MTTLKIEHAITDFDTWRAAFGRDPAGRQASGVRRYRVFRPVDDDRYVLVHLDFDGPAPAHAFLEKLEAIWARTDLSPGLARTQDPSVSPARGRVFEQVEAYEY